MSLIEQRATAPASRSITQLADLVAALSPAERARFNRLMHVSIATGRLESPESMHAWIRGLFGTVEAVEEQLIVKTTNCVTHEGTLFNALRSSRPMETELPEDLDAIVTSGVGDPFCRPLEGTPADVFGRVSGQHGITASNIAKYDAFHGVIVFNEHNPLAFDREEIADYLDIGFRWADEVLRCDPAARYYFFMWNCMWKSGASILHGHAQIACTQDLHYAKIEHLRAAAESYQAQYGANYFADLIDAHRALGLTTTRGDTTIMASLTPIKEKEVWLVAEGLSESMKDSIYRVLDCYTRHLGVVSFNLVAYLPPLRPSPESWDGFPFVVRIVDRGALANKTADFGAMELYASSVVASDPFKVIAAIEAYA